MYLLFGANNGRFGVKYKHSGVVREVLDSSNYTSYAIPNSASCNKNWSYSGQSGQPTWLWGTNDGTNCYVWNPSNFSVNYANSANTSNRTKFLETFHEGSTTDTYGTSYPIWAQWANSTNVRLKCTDYTVWTDKADYATSAGNTDTVDGYHSSDLVKFYLSPMINDAPADSAKSWFTNTMPSASGAIVYNVPGSEKTIIVGKSSSGAYGHMLQLNYDDNYLRILRYKSSSWQSTNWEKISAGYADSAGSATKLQTPRTIWGQSFDGTGNVNGTIYINNSDSSNGAIRLNNNVNSNARISAISDQVIFNTGSAIRFGGTAWDWNQWAGLKYTHSNKTIYLGIADNSIFNANSAQSGGTLNLRAGISNIDLNSGTSIRGLPTDGSPYSSSITLQNAAISLLAYGDISMSTGPGAINLTAGQGAKASIGSDFKIESSRGIYLTSGQSTNASINPEGFKVEASQGIYLNSSSYGNVYLCQGVGKVGIGTSSPLHKLHVMGNTFTKGFGIIPHYLSDSDLLPHISPGDGYVYRCLEIGTTEKISCIIADKVSLSGSRGVLIKFREGYDGQIVLLKDLENYGSGNGFFWVMPSKCKIIRADDSGTLISQNQISNTYDDGHSRFFVYSSKYSAWIEFLCA